MKVAVSVLLREYKSSSSEYKKLIECSQGTINLFNTINNKLIYNLLSTINFLNNQFSAISVVIILLQYGVIEIF